jgi:predicted transposase YbfD/YdcC/uncharacterized membrane protein
MLSTMTGTNFWALQYLQLAETGSIQFSVPIIIALIAAPLLGERLDAARWTAIGVGFAGVLIIVRPGTQGFHPALLLAIANAVLYALFNLMTRRLAAHDSPEATQFFTSFGATLAITPFALAAWQAPPGVLQWLILCLIGIAGGLGHYLLALKGNQPGLEKDMQEMYHQGTDNDFDGMEQNLYETNEKAHGRTECRTYHAVEIPQDHPQRRVWKDLYTLIVVTTWRIINGSETSETRWYVSSHAPRAKALGRAIRKHWSIENGQHWVLDIAFGEDWRRQQARQGATNLAAIRRLAVSLLRQDKTLKRGAKCKRMACALDQNYLLRVLHHAKFDA